MLDTIGCLQSRSSELHAHVVGVVRVAEVRGVVSPRISGREVVVQTRSRRNVTKALGRRRLVTVYDFSLKLISKSALLSRTCH